MCVAKATERKPKPPVGAAGVLDELRQLEHRLRNLSWPLRMRGDLAREQSAELQKRLQSVMDTASDLLAQLRRHLP